MATIIVTCTGCATRLQAPVQAAGKQVKCAKCSKLVAVPLLLPVEEDEAQRSRGRPKEEDEEPSNSDEESGPSFASRLFKKAVLIPLSTFYLGLLMGGVSVWLYSDRGRSSPSGGGGSSSTSGGIPSATTADQEKRDYERVKVLEKDFAAIKRQEEQELRNANMQAGRLDPPGSARNRMTEALGRAEARQQQKQAIQLEYLTLVRKYPHWGKPATLPD